jgi:hypothetical protein
MSTSSAKLRQPALPLSCSIIEASRGKLRCCPAKPNTTVQNRTSTERASVFLPARSPPVYAPNLGNALF